MKLDLLAIAAHPDDVELTCGGTLLKAAEQGYKTGILDLTAGEMGTRGTPETRLKEASTAARILRVSHRENLRLPDAHLEVNQEYKLGVARRIRALKPHTVILPYWEGRHPDHYTAANRTHLTRIVAMAASLRRTKSRTWFAGWKRITLRSSRKFPRLRTASTCWRSIRTSPTCPVISGLTPIAPPSPVVTSLFSR